MNTVRWFLMVAFLAVAALTTPRVGAQHGAGLEGLAYPELHVTLTDDGFSVPEVVTAGRTLIVYENQSGEAFQSWLVRVPDEVTAAEIAAPVAVGEGPEWFFRGTFVGFPGFVRPGEVTNAVVDLTPGLYCVFDDMTALFRVVPGDGEAATPAAPVDPTAEIEVTMSEYDFQIPETVPAGEHIWKVTNSGNETHEFVIGKSPLPVTEQQIFDLVMGGDFAATPPGGGPSLNDIEAGEVAGFGALSPGLSGWTELNYEPGTYVAICFVPDPMGMPHVALGMIQVFTVV